MVVSVLVVPVVVVPVVVVEQARLTEPLTAAQAGQNSLAVWVAPGAHGTENVAVLPSPSFPKYKKHSPSS